MASVRSQKKRRTQFITTSADDVTEDLQAWHDQFETNDTPSLLAESTKPKHHGHAQENASLGGLSQYNPIELMVLGACAGATVALLVICFRLSHRARRRKMKNLKAWTNDNMRSWTNEIHFKDECSSDNSDLENAERRAYNDDFNEDYPIDYTNNDWLGGVGFDGNETGNVRANANPFVFAEKAASDSSSSNGGDDNDIALFNALNGSSPDTQNGSPLTLDSPPPSPQMTPTNLLDSGLSPTNLLDADPQFSPPTVSELFQNTISSHWRKAAPPLSLDRTSVSSGSSNGSINEELAMERDDLNKSLFLLNDQILEQQRNLSAASEKARRQEITREIRRLEGDKRDIESKLRTNRSKIKANKQQRRKILMGK